MVFNFSKLKGRIVEMFDTQRAFAEKMGWTEQYLSRKLNNEVGFTLEDIVKAVELLELTPEDIGVYFFTVAV